MVPGAGDSEHAGVTHALHRTRNWLMQVRPPLLAVAVGVGVGVVQESAAVAGLVSGVAVVLIVGWREYWRPSSWFTRGDA